MEQHALRHARFEAGKSYLAVHTGTLENLENPISLCARTVL